MYVYQPKIETLPLFINNKPNFYTLEQWVYKVDQKWWPGGRALRVSENLIVDNLSNWVTIN